MANLCKLSFKICSVDEVSQRDISSFLKSISPVIDPYVNTRGLGADNVDETLEGGVAASVRLAGATGPRAARVPMASTTSKQVVAERIKWKLGPSFDPVPYLQDPVVKKAFVDPECLRKPASEWPRKAKAL